jgi:hypothetical protein
LETSADKDRDMSAVARTDLRLFAAEEWPLMNHKGRLRNLAKLLPRWTDRRVRAVYNAEQGVSLRAEEFADIQALIEEENRDEFQALQARIARLEAALFAQDEEFHFDQMAALRSASNGRRGPDVSLTSFNASEEGE